MTKNPTMLPTPEIELLNELEGQLNRPESKEAKRAKSDFGYFISKIFPAWKLKPFHREAIRLLESTNSEDERLLFLWPRGFGKSSLTSVAYPLWRIAKNRDVRVVIATNIQRLGMEWLREMEDIMMKNFIYRDWFGNMVPEPRTLTWTDTEKIVLGRTPMATHTTLYTIAVGGSALGKRADVLIVDDIMEPEEGIMTSLMANKVNEWFWKVLYPVCEPGSKKIVIGTRFGDGDLYGRLVDRRWNTFRIPALDEHGESTFPERFSTKELHSRREDMGTTIFNLQYMNDIGGLIGNMLKSDWLHYYFETPPLREMTVMMAVDPQAFDKVKVKDGTDPDYFIIMVGGYYAKIRTLYLLDMIRTRATPMRQLELIKTQLDKWHPAVTGIESNASQVFVAEMVQKTTNLPIKKVPSVTSKELRFMSMSALFEAGRILIPGTKDADTVMPREEFKAFKDEWALFPNGKHDDTLDAASILARMLPNASQKAAVGSLDVKDDKPQQFMTRPIVKMFDRTIGPNRVNILRRM